MGSDDQTGVEIEAVGIGAVETYAGVEVELIAAEPLRLLPSQSSRPCRGAEVLAGDM
ncbi:MAG: hypothetical protein WD404_05285 [Solirubrobacterales bacterium]